MAMKETQPCPSLCWLMLMLLSPCFRMLHADEVELLWSFKSSVNDPFQHLSNWNPSLTFCKWQGISCGNNSRVNVIDLSSKNISGKLSSSIFQLPFIETINLSSNQLAGEIPHDMFSASRSSLRYLNLSNNNLTGSIPAGPNPSLEIFDLSNNMLSGKIPEEIGSLSSLKFLDLGGNVLVGRIPISITNITGLQVLTLASNQLVGVIPAELGRLKSLKWIYMGYNNLSGEIPNEIGQLTSLNHLDLVYNNLTGEIPSSLGNLSNLQYLFLYQNKLKGLIPRSIFDLKNLVSLDLSDNSLSGQIPELIIQMQNLEILHLFSNNFTGKIPTALGSLPRLQVLQLWSNKLSGEIPKDLGKLNNLTVLDLSTNSLTGKIPGGLCNSGYLFKLILFSNSLEGEIPKSLGACRSLQRVRLQDNGLSGELPPEFTKLSLVYFLDISSNHLSGRIDGRKWEMYSLKMLNLARNRFSGHLPNSFGSNKLENLDLSHNGFSGPIPHSFGNLLELMQLKLNENKLFGNIPENLCSCNKLVSLDLSHNHLSGQLPTGFSNIPVLSQLDVSQNQLSGEVPRNLGTVESLVEVNISHNHFHGSLPSTGAFLAINASAVAGNDLCGGDASSGLAPCRRARSLTRWLVVVYFLAGFILLAITAFSIIFLRRRKHMELKKVENEDGVWELQFFHKKVSQSMTIDDIFSSTKQENVISSGKEGILYNGLAIMSNMQFVVKEIRVVHSIPPSVWAEISEFGMLQHPNIVKLTGVCRSDKVAYLVYEYIDGSKTLNEVLRNLSWERRRKIAVGIARALRYLHCYCFPSVTVGNMSPENVTIDGNDEPRLRVNLPYELLPTVPECLISSTYVAPETRKTKEVTEKSDMYGFGLILIQLLTGKSPDDPEFGAQENIVEWARYCYSDCHLDLWVDPGIRSHPSSSLQQNHIVEAMNLALYCTATDPTARPGASHVYTTLHTAFKTTSWGLALNCSSPS
ncbi:hypothetical protein K2173_016426 [Erythroxylum novogranatense]|uniref:non-specific serine/threonine protein kinase n=1 Tax=Erythroxylum novogranatense TaxID=1862640 RepID=A0AAV8SH31_9ROSI|nr:hypothetical protein K2173_016426 [Erythroxylum novogranatense]